MSSRQPAEYATYTTIHRQPDEVARLLREGWDAAEAAAARLRAAPRLLLVGIGTSFHACLVGEHLLRAAGREAWAVPAFDFVTYPLALRRDDAVVVVSHRGNKRFAAAALERARAAGCVTIGISGQDSKMPEADLVLRTVPQERSAMHTASYTGSLTVLAQIATRLAPPGSAPAADWPAALAALPGQMRGVLAREGEVRELAARVAGERQIYVVGAGPNAPTAPEGALKVKEAAYHPAEGLAVETFIHGPLVCLDPADRLVLVAVAGPALPRLADLARAASAIGARIWLVGVDDPAFPATDRFPLPAVLEPLSPLLTVLPLQLLACFLALAHGTNPDSFRAEHAPYRTAQEMIAL